jgi:hypothetical protein
MLLCNIILCMLDFHISVFFFEITAANGPYLDWNVTLMAPQCYLWYLVLFNTSARPSMFFFAETQKPWLMKLFHSKSVPYLILNKVCIFCFVYWKFMMHPPLQNKGLDRTMWGKVLRNWNLIAPRLHMNNHWMDSYKKKYLCRNWKLKTTSG